MPSLVHPVYPKKSVCFVVGFVFVVLDVVVVVVVVVVGDFSFGSTFDSFNWGLWNL